MATILDYQNRRFDAAAFRGQTPSGEVKLGQSLFDVNSSGEVMTGTAKLAQRFTMEFLTEQGSMPYLPDRGTEFMTEARAGHLLTEQDVILQFNLAMNDVAQNLVSEEALYEELLPMQDDEKFESAELTGLALLGDFLTLTVRVFSIAGDSREVILPISVLPVDVRV